MPSPAQHGMVDSTRLIAALQPKLLDGMNRSYMDHTPTLRMLRSKGRFQTVDSYNCRMLVETGPSSNAGIRDIGERLPNDVRNIGGSEVRFSNQLQEIDVYLSWFYFGFFRDGQFMDVAGPGMRKYVDILKRQAQSARERMAFLHEMALCGNGSGEYCEVSSVSGNVITVKKSSGTLANSGQYGLKLLRYARQSVRIINPVTGTARTSGGNAGFQVVSVRKTAGELVMNVDVSAVAQAGDIIVEGDDNATSYGSVFPGYDAWNGNSTHRAQVYGLARDADGNDWLSATVIDAQTTDALGTAVLGQLNMADIARAQIEADFEHDGGRADVVLIDPLLWLEGPYGSAIAGSGDPGVRTLEGYQALRRFNATGPLTAGASAMRVQTGPYGTVELLPTRNARPNTVYGLNTSTYRVLQLRGGIRPLGGGAGEGGEALRVAFRDQYEHGGCMASTLINEMPNKGNFRIDNVAQQTGRV